MSAMKAGKSPSRTWRSVAKAYLKSSNRTLGEFIPAKTPDRAEIPAAPDGGTDFVLFVTMRSPV